MSRLFIWLASSGLFALLGTYSCYSMDLPAFEIEKNQNAFAEILMDTVAEITCFKKKLTSIKAPEEALTLSRFEKDGKVHTLAVLEDDGEYLRGVDISMVLNRYDENVFDVIKNLDFDHVVKLIRTSDNSVSISYKDLLPSVGGNNHMAIGINYAEHGKETGQVKPFMFPKLVDTDPAVHSLHYTDGWLLDHEVELGVVFGEPVCSSADLNKIKIGFLTVNDFTDRAELMRKMDSKNVTGGKGFPDAKSKSGFLPTGPYVVIPKDWKAFVQELDLQLSVNGEIRQHGYAKDMVWDIQEIINRSLSVKGLNNSYYKDKMIKLFQGDCIPANSIVITGTPSGVVFNAPKGGFIFGTVMKYIFTGAFFSDKMHPYILKQYLKKELKNPRYLKIGDNVETSIKYLGTIKTTVVK